MKIENLNRKNFKELVFDQVKKIPKGKVTTYGQISHKLRIKNGEDLVANGQVRITPRMVGWALHQNKSADIPCHRVVDRNGRLASNFAFNGWKEQRRRLLLEGVNFKDDMHIDLGKNLWHL